VPKRIEDGSQMDLFGGAPEPRRPPPVRPPRRRPAAAEAPPEVRPPGVDAPVPEGPPDRAEAAPLPPAPLPEATLASLAAAATHPDLEDLIAGLGDEQLSFLALAALRELRQRAAPKRRSETAGPASPQALRRALRRLAEELGGEV
jgi:hypothetical protein